VDVKDFMETVSKIEEELKNNEEKEVNLNQLADEYKKLRQASESIKNIIDQLTPINQGVIIK